MKNLLFTALLLAAMPSVLAQNDLKSVLSQLDATLSHRDSYIAGREQRIESLKSILGKSDFSDAQRLHPEPTTDRRIHPLPGRFHDQLPLPQHQSGQKDARRTAPRREPHPTGLPLQFGRHLPRSGHPSATDRHREARPETAGRLLRRPPQTQRRTPTLLPRLGAGHAVVAPHGALRPADRGEHRAGIDHAPQFQALAGDQRPQLRAGGGDLRTAVQHPAAPFARLRRGVVHAGAGGGPDEGHPHGAGVVRPLGDDRHPAGDPRQCGAEKPRQHAARRRQHPAGDALHANRHGRRAVLQLPAPALAGRAGPARHRGSLHGPAAADGRHVQHLRGVDRLLHAAGPRGRDLRPAPEPQAQPRAARTATGQQPAQHLEQRPATDQRTVGRPQQPDFRSQRGEGGVHRHFPDDVFGIHRQDHRLAAPGAPSAARRAHRRTEEGVRIERRRQPRTGGVLPAISTRRSCNSTPRSSRTSTRCWTRRHASSPRRANC